MKLETNLALKFLSIISTLHLMNVGTARNGMNIAHYGG
jgi:hypothetical protein